jgi:two-component system nitrogen regulation sensor histidine kinase NtrY
VRVEPKGSAEVERLIRTFNTMSAELSRSRVELARAERLTAWREAARRVAHEMKNALTPITFSLHRLKKAAPSMSGDERDRIQSSLDTLTEEVEGLRRLAASFSELARLPVPEMAPVSLPELVRTTVEALEDGAGVSWSAPAEPVVVQGDRTLLRQALTNLVKNALEATRDGGRVWVQVEESGDRARITVDDDGPGWPAGAREAVLEPYYTTKTQGTGLGLSLVQRTLLQHGGSLELSDRPGGGARVTLSLPRYGPAATPADRSSTEETL